MDSPDWNHVCFVRDRGIGITRYYLNGIQLDYQVCDGGALPAGKSLQLGGGNRKGTDVEMTGFYLWNRELAESHIINEAKKCNGGGMGQPLVHWRDFNDACGGDIAFKPVLRTPSQCQVPRSKCCRQF